MIIGVDTLPRAADRPGRPQPHQPVRLHRQPVRVPRAGLGADRSPVPMVMINTIMAESLDYMRHRARDGRRRRRPTSTTPCRSCSTEIITEHGAVVFNGDGYSENWQIEAAERGLPNLRTTLDALPELITDEAIELFEKYGVFNEREMHSRYEIGLEQYALTIGVEAKLTLEIGIDGDPAGGDPLPDRAGAERRRAQGGRCRGRHRRCSTTVSAPIAELTAALAGARRRRWRPTAATRPLAEAAHARDALLPAMDAVRAAADTLEGIVADDLWPLPTYQEMLYIL